ncbi:MAG: glycoside hydrolase family 28 protein [Draconibacterium sp.]
MLQGKDQKFRPWGIYLEACKNIAVEGIYMKHSAFWMQRYLNCDYLKFTNLTIFNHSNLNNDGIDIDGCHSVVIANCIIDSSDDAIVLKSESLRACEDIVISNCILSSHATALKLGTGSVGGFKRIAIDNIVIRKSKATEMIHTMKAWGGICGIDIENVDGGVLEDVLINNIIIDGTNTPLFIKLGNRNSTWDGKPDAVPGILQNVRISNLTARNCGMVSSSITGYPGQNVKNIHLSNIDISVTGNTDPADTTLLVPEYADRYPYNRMFQTELPSYGFYIRHAENVTFENIKLYFDVIDIRPALVLVVVMDMLISGLESQKPD